MAETAKKRDPAKWARAKAKARKKMGWLPSITFEKLIKEMVESDLEWYSKKQNGLEKHTFQKKEIRTWIKKIRK